MSCICVVKKCFYKIFIAILFCWLPARALNLHQVKFDNGKTKRTILSQKMAYFLNNFFFYKSSRGTYSRATHYVLSRNIISYRVYFVFVYMRRFKPKIDIFANRIRLGVSLAIANNR